MKTLLIQRSWCKGCRICVTFCPKKVLELDHEDKVYMKYPEKCIYCRLCELRCPDLVFEIKEGEEAEAAKEKAAACGCSAPAKSKKKA